MDLKIKVTHVAYHRNGVGGMPFHVVRFYCDEAGIDPMLGFVFEAPQTVAVINATEAANGNIAFQTNSWRGDNFEHLLREAIAAHESKRGKE